MDRKKQTAQVKAGNRCPTHLIHPNQTVVNVCGRTRLRCLAAYAAPRGKSRLPKRYHTPRPTRGGRFKTEVMSAVHLSRSSGVVIGVFGETGYVVIASSTAHTRLERVYARQPKGA